MVLSELKTGMRVILRDGSENVVFKDMNYNSIYHSNILLDINEGTYISLREYSNDMTMTNDDSEFDIMQVYTIDDSFNVMIKLSDLKTWGYTLLYDREKEEEPKELTKEQIEELLGYKIKILD